MNKIIEDYAPYQQALTKNMNKVNELQRTLNFKEFYDVTIRCTNANVRAMKFMKKHKLDFENESLTNCDNALMLAARSYILSIYIQAQNEYSMYIEETNKISDKVVDSVDFKFRKKIAPKIARYTGKIIDLNARPKYIESQKHVDKFLELGEIITNYEVNKDIIPTLETYLPIVYANLRKTKLHENKYQNIINRNNLFHLRVMQLMACLKKTGLDEAVPTLQKLEVDIMTENLKDEMQMELPEVEDLEKTLTKRK